MTTALHGRGDSSSSAITVIPDSVPFHHLYLAEEVRQDLADQHFKISAMMNEMQLLEGEKEVDSEAQDTLADEIGDELKSFSATAKEAMTQMNRQRNLLRITTATIGSFCRRPEADELFGTEAVKIWRTDLPLATGMLDLGVGESHASDPSPKPMAWPTTPEEDEEGVITPATVDRLWDSLPLVPSRGVQSSYSLLASLWTICQTEHGRQTAGSKLVREYFMAHELWPSLPETSLRGSQFGYNETMRSLTLDTLRTLDEAYARDTSIDLSEYDGADVDDPVFQELNRLRQIRQDKVRSQEQWAGGSA